MGKAGMKASSFLKIGVNRFVNRLTQKNICLLYIYNIIKRNTQGLVSLFYFSLVFLMDNQKK